MSYADYWDGPCEMVPAILKADEIEQERRNTDAWLQGLYIREAIASAMDGRKHKYPKEPFTLNTSISKERAKQAQEQNERKATDYFMTFMEQWNKKFAERKKEEVKAKDG